MNKKPGKEKKQRKLPRVTLVNTVTGETVKGKEAMRVLSTLIFGKAKGNKK